MGWLGKITKRIGKTVWKYRYAPIADEMTHGGKPKEERKYPYEPVQKPKEPKKEP